MTYTRQANGEVIVQMSADEYDELMLMFGHAIAAAIGRGRRREFYAWLHLANALNAGNRAWEPFAIPDEFLPR